MTLTIQTNLATTSLEITQVAIELLRTSFQEQKERGRFSLREFSLTNSLPLKIILLYWPLVGRQLARILKDPRGTEHKLMRGLKGLIANSGNAWEPQQI